MLNSGRISGFTIAHYTDVGGRGNNEDAYAIVQSPVGELYMVADGLGGQEDGEVASMMATASLKEQFLKFDGGDAFDWDVSMAVNQANNEIFTVNSNRQKIMATTVSIMVVGSERTRLAHVGDSRIYAFKNSVIRYQSIDHSASQMAVMAGEITSEQIRSHPDRNRLVRAVGSREKVKVDIEELSNQEFDAFLVCSDGFWEFVTEREMCEFLAKSENASEWLEMMRKTVIERTDSKDDNNTAIAGIKERM